MTECSICCEKFNVSKRKRVNCAFCEFEACRACAQKYLLSSVNDPHCMNCKNAWGREVVDEACTKTFRNKELKIHRENILLDREKCMMPETQPLVVREIQIRTTVTLLHQAQIELENQREMVRNLERTVANLRTGAAIVGVDPEDTRKVFVRKCPCEGCRGFLSTQWKCGVCEKRICPECNEEKPTGVEHVCDQNNVDTVALLKKDTKSCPKCGTMIFKISGCSQMWCPDCHTAFNWNTMKIELGIIHNPHYYEFQRNNATARPAGRNLGDIPCGGFPTAGEMRTFVLPHTDPKQYERIFQNHRTIAHIQQYELMYVYRTADQPVNNADLRVKYMMNELTDDQFKATVQKREKAKEKIRDIANILRMFSDTGADIMRQMVQEPTAVANQVQVLDNLRRYTNETFKKINMRYSCVTPYINEMFVLQTEKWKP